MEKLEKLVVIQAIKEYFGVSEEEWKVVEPMVIHFVESTESLLGSMRKDRADFGPEVVDTVVRMKLDKFLN